MAAQRRALFVLPAFILGCALAGGLLGSSGQRSDTAAPSGSEESVNSALNSFAKVYDLVQQNEASKVAPDKSIYKGAIPGMLRTLDPHSNFFDPKEFAAMREEQHGLYYGNKGGLTIYCDFNCLWLHWTSKRFNSMVIRIIVKVPAASRGNPTTCQLRMQRRIFRCLFKF
jgi:hypothetical protein